MKPPTPTPPRKSGPGSNVSPAPTPAAPIENSEANSEEAQMIPIDGFRQIVEMLKVADPAFRESLLKRVAMHDRKLAHSLRKDLLENS